MGVRHDFRRRVRRDCVDTQELSFLSEVSVALISKEKQKHGHKEKESTKCAALVHNLKLPLLDNDLRFFSSHGTRC